MFGVPNMSGHHDEDIYGHGDVCGHNDPSSPCQAKDQSSKRAFHPAPATLLRLSRNCRRCLDLAFLFGRGNSSIAFSALFAPWLLVGRVSRMRVGRGVMAFERTTFGDSTIALKKMG